MSQLQELSGAAQPIAGYFISPPRLVEFGMAEKEAARQYLDSIYKATEGLPDTFRQTAIRKATDNLMADPFAAFAPGSFLDSWMKTAAALPYLLWLSLRIKNPNIKENEATAMINDGDRLEIRQAVLTAWGFKFADNKKKESLPLTGAESTTSLAPTVSE
jgi:hypothetical protein